MLPHYLWLYITGLGWDTGTKEDNKDEATRYFRESTALNSHHLHWHDVVSSRMERFGELFYYMHRQILARYEAERLSSGLERTKPFCYDDWDNPIEEGYDPRLGEWWTPRPGGMVMGSEIERQTLKKYYEDIKDVVKKGGVFKDGKDEGLEELGRLVEKTLHNAGHQYLNKMGGNGVIGTAVASLRDPVFYRWHSCLENIFRSYKESLGEYTEQELGFPGVKIIELEVKSEGSSHKNTLTTFMETEEIHLRNMDGDLDLKYDQKTPVKTFNQRRLNHIPFIYKLRIKSKFETEGVVRIFLKPFGEDGNRNIFELDRFHINLKKGVNNIRRHESLAPHLYKSKLSVGELQDKVMEGKMSKEEYNMVGCGWPINLNIPRGRAGGMRWEVVAMISNIVEDNKETWESASNQSWAYCGVQQGGIPDTRPMGFPFDRNFHNLHRLMLDTSIGRMRSNWAMVHINIKHSE